MNSTADDTGLSRVCLVVPCYNEARRLSVPKYRDFLALNPDKRILFIDDGSRDETANVLHKICSGFEDHAAILSPGRNQGKAEAVRTAINYALRTFEQAVIGYWDADLATPLDSVGRFLAVLDDQPQIEMVFGSRVKLLGRRIERNEWRHYLGRIFATTVSSMLGLAIYDTQTGAKMFRVDERARQVFAEPFLSKWVFDVEIIARYMRLFKHEDRHIEDAIYEYPLEVWVDVEDSKVRPADFFRSFFDVLKIRRKYL